MQLDTRRKLWSFNDSLSPRSILKEVVGGWGGIRTHGTLTRTAVFKTAALNRSATHPVAGEATLTPRASQVLTKDDVLYHVWVPSVSPAQSSCCMNFWTMTSLAALLVLPAV